jgi:hypothetical protein
MTGSRRLGKSTTITLLLVLAALVVVGVWLAVNPPSSVLETISCPVHRPGQTPWPGLPEACRW